MFSYPTPPSLLSLDPIELKSLALGGALIHLGNGYRPAGWPDTPASRTRAMERFTLPELVFISTTAAWIWGAPIDCPDAPKLSTIEAKRFPATLIKGLRVHEYHVSAEEIINFAELKVSSPTRTLYDLLFLSETEYKRRGRTAVRYLVNQYSIPFNEVQANLEKKFVPHSVRARKRLDEAAL